MKIKARLKKCSTYPHETENMAYNKVIEVDFIDQEEYGGDIRHISGMADDFEYYHCWNTEDIEIIEFEL